MARPDGVYDWRNAGRGKSDGDNLISHSMKGDWGPVLSAYLDFFYLSGGDLERARCQIPPILRPSMDETVDGGRCFLYMWASRRKQSVEAKSTLYGVSWIAAFPENADWSTSEGMGESHKCASAESLLYAVRFARKYESRKSDVPRMCILDCVLKFDESGAILEGDAALPPRNVHYYQIFEFNLIDVD